MVGSPILMGDNTIPGVKLPESIRKVYPKILQAVRDFGCDPYDTIVESLTYDEISEIASYGGFPVRYPHWSHGMEFEGMSRRYEFGMHKIYEMVINNDPCYLYILDSNPFVDQVTVIAHALGHCDFFKNNIWFEPTTKNALNEFANHGTRIKRYMERWGKDRVLQFIDWVLCIDDLIDPAKAWVMPKMQQAKIRDERKYRYPRRLKIPETDGLKHDYMEDWINPKNWIDKEYERIRRQEIIEELEIFKGGERDVLGFLMRNAPLTIWQADILSMLYREAQYFYPQRQTKMLNEGWASFVDYNIMARQRWAEASGIFHYAKHKAGVLGGKHSMNPYALGFKLFLHIEDRWNKGRFGKEYEECDDAKKKREWDTKAGLGHEKVFEVRRWYNDVMAIHEFVDQEFVDDFEMFQYKKYPLRDGSFEYRIESRDANVIKKLLMQQFVNGGRPDISLEDPNYGNKNLLFLQHNWEGRVLHRKYSQATLQAIWSIWTRGGQYNRDVAIASKDKDEREIVYVCSGPASAQNIKLTRKEFEEIYG